MLSSRGVGFFNGGWMEAVKVEEGYRNLSASVISQAFNDLKSDKISERRSATKFFKNADFRLWADVLKIDHDVLLKKYYGIIEDIIFSDLHIETKHTHEIAALNRYIKKLKKEIEEVA